MNKLIAACAAAALVASPLAAAAQTHSGGFGHGGGVARSAGGFARAGAYRGGYARGGYARGGYRGGYYGGGYYGGGYPYWGGFGLGLAFGAAAWAPWYYGDYYPSFVGYYPAYYDYPPSYDEYYGDDYDGDYDDGGAPPHTAATAPQAGPAAPTAVAPAQAQSCGQWVWHADAQRYVWTAANCGAPS